MYITPVADLIPPAPRVPPISPPLPRAPAPPRPRLRRSFSLLCLLGGFPVPAHSARESSRRSCPPPPALPHSHSCVEIRSALAGESAGIPFPPRRRQVPRLEISVFHIQDFPPRPFLPPFAALLAILPPPARGRARACTCPW